MPIAKRETEPLLPNAADIDVIGPFAEKLFDLDHIYNRNEYPTVHARADEWLTVNESEATPYLPDPNTRKVTIGIKELETVDLPVGAVLNLNNHISTKYAFILNLGFSVFALEFAPKRPEIDSARHTQYLAIAGFRGAENEHHYYTDSYTHGEYKNSIMLWRCELVNTEQAQQQQQQQQPVLDLCLLHDFGPIKEIKWCPYGAYEEAAEEGWPKLGILAVASSDNKVHVLVVPHPHAVRESIHETDASKPVFMRITKSRVVFQLDNMIPMTVAWGGTNQLSIGYTNGQLAHWDIRKALTTEMEEKDAINEKYLINIAYAHDSCIRSIAWHGLVDPVNFATGANDGLVQIFDYRDPYLPMHFFRNRMIPYSLSWPGFSSRLNAMDGDNFLRSAVTDESTRNDLTVRGNKTAMNIAPTQALAASELHPFVVIGNTNGWCKSVNSHLIRKRKEMKIQMVPYKLNYDGTTKTFRYIDGIQPMSLDESKKESQGLVYVENIASLRKSAWCPNRTSCGWAASVGAAGLCRIEFLGQGANWT